MLQPKLVCQFVRIHINFFRFFSNSWKPRLSNNVWVVFANRFDRLSRNFLSFAIAKTYPNFVTFDRFFKTKKKFRILEKNLKKFICIRTNWQINFVLKKFKLPVFLLSNFFFHYFFTNFLEWLICEINVLTSFRMVDSFHIFIPLYRKYWKYSLNLSFCWSFLKSSL